MLETGEIVCVAISFGSNHKITDYTLLHLKSKLQSTRRKSVNLAIVKSSIETIIPRYVCQTKHMQAGVNGMGKVFHAH